ncbi:hypothetical protein [uncultured Psychroserpens sp.]|uniref:hypothetical protein n=1 Tax=uncultured Psychroserpens sp. TaxID=255436 RepID=UPI0026112618|nr:hypothetical protein [uncultured Psychroserpens sp.]
MIRYFLLLGLFSVCACGQTEKTNNDNYKKVFFIDSVEVEKSALKKYDPSEISSISELKIEKDRVELIYIETIKFQKYRYWKYLSEKSEEYLKLVPNYNEDSYVQYIINGKVLKRDFESTLSSIDDVTFLDIKFIDRETLKNDYNISDKSNGVVIRTIGSVPN